MLVMAARLSISLKLINQERERVPGEPLLLQESILVKEGKERLVELSITISWVKKKGKSLITWSMLWKWVIKRKSAKGELLRNLSNNKVEAQRLVIQVGLQLVKETIQLAQETTVDHQLETLMQRLTHWVPHYVNLRLQQESLQTVDWLIHLTLLLIRKKKLLGLILILVFLDILTRNNSNAEEGQLEEQLQRRQLEANLLVTVRAKGSWTLLSRRKQKDQIWIIIKCIKFLIRAIQLEDLLKLLTSQGTLPERESNQAKGDQGLPLEKRTLEAPSDRCISLLSLVLLFWALLKAVRSCRSKYRISNRNSSKLMVFRNNDDLW